MKERTSFSQLADPAYNYPVVTYLINGRIHCRDPDTVMLEQAQTGQNAKGEHKGRKISLKPKKGQPKVKNWPGHGSLVQQWGQGGGTQHHQQH